MGKSKFQTIVDIPHFQWKTDYGKRNLFMGSCFTENVGNKMANLKYRVDINPFGILYNPMSVANALELLLKKKIFCAEDLIKHNNLWHSFSHHGRFSSIDIKECLEGINNRIQLSAEFLNETDYLFLTFGTAWVYRNIKSGKVVSNCHKIHAKEFTRKRISVNEIVDTYTQILNKIWSENPKLKVVFTVSPIRHWKDGAIENQRSKATLLLAIDKLVNDLGNSNCAYFPSYEIVMDELRDYRFYTDDMLHISEVGINHIWQIFEEHMVELKSIKTAREVEKIINAVRHRPINKKSIEFYNFLTSFRKKIAELEKRFPFLNLKIEKEYFNIEIEKYNLHNQ